VGTSSCPAGFFVVRYIVELFLKRVFPIISAFFEEDKIVKLKYFLQVGTFLFSIGFYLQCQGEVNKYWNQPLRFSISSGDSGASAGEGGAAPGAAVGGEDVALSQAVNDFSDMTAEQIRHIKNFPDIVEGDTTNVARAAVIAFSATGESNMKASNCIFLSGWDRTTNKYDKGKKQANLDALNDGSTEEEYRYCSLGDFYPELEATRKNSPSGEEGSASEAKFNQDFETRGVELKPEKSFSNSTYSHTEQAYISEVLNLKKPIFDIEFGVPKMVVMVFTSYHPPCTTCGPLLNRLLSNTPLKRAFLQKYFSIFKQNDQDTRAGTVDVAAVVDDIKVHVIFVSVDYHVVNGVLPLYNESHYIFSRR